MADVQIRFGPVIGDEDLAVLERVHGARIHVYVWIELLHDDPKTPGCEQIAKAGSREAFAQRGGDASGYEYVSGRPCHGTSQ
ncbi:hypothetical protein Rhe02_96750 [Rhizocola hellebori]|uniref:Uncharacterized protein n=1 Tax=Rhizocola hellebori TaxID=1392758 RepID=A0A8J3VMY6_9ACTN|nr:hypothetical protein Rhe02_96750 [Rhizocola hellebori]